RASGEARRAGRPCGLQAHRLLALHRHAARQGPPPRHLDLGPGPVARLGRAMTTEGDPFGGAYRGKRVLVTGHTGFKGAWLGTAHVLESLRRLDHPCSAVIITSDKPYRNVEWEWGQRETDELGGRDPYSASKACAELVIRSYQSSYVFADSSLVRMA